LSCNKHYAGHPTLAAGILTAFCEHGICLGFSLMRNHESPNMPFTILLTRFPKAPEIVIYDNSCHLLSYCLNRQPNHFKNTLFLIDRFHVKNHTTCSQYGFNISRHLGLGHVNTQIVEQKNSVLAKLRSQLSYMRVESFMTHTTLYSTKKRRKSGTSPDN